MIAVFLPPLWGSASRARLRTVCGSYAEGRRKTPVAYALPPVVVLLFVLAVAPVLGFWLDWRLGLFLAGAYAVLFYGMWRVSRQK